jgi:putative endonuclease
MYSEKRQIGNLGEDIAVKKLEQLGFDIIERNYLRKWGEIDIVARGTDHKLHFVEVKSMLFSQMSKNNVSRDTFLPEENVTREKLRKLTRVIETWIQERKYSGEWLIDVVTVHIDMEHRVGHCKLIEGVTFD